MAILVMNEEITPFVYHGQKIKGFTQLIKMKGSILFPLYIKTDLKTGDQEIFNKDIDLINYIVKNDKTERILIMGAFNRVMIASIMDAYYKQKEKQKEKKKVEEFEMVQKRYFELLKELAISSPKRAQTEAKKSLEIVKEELVRTRKKK